MSKPVEKRTEPIGDLCIRTIAMPADTNINGDIFGGWILSQMDMAGSRIAHKRAMSRTVTAAIDGMSFFCPVKVGDYLCCYCELIKVGRTSMQIHVEAWALNQFETERKLVTEGVFTYVAIDDRGRPRPVEPPLSSV